MRNLKIEEVGEPLNQSTLDVWVDQKDVVEILNADSSNQKLREKIDNENIRYEEKGILNKIKFSFLRLFL